METVAEVNKYSRARLDDRQVTELIGIARGLIADDFLSDPEIEFLHKWLAASAVVTTNPLIGMVEERLTMVLDDGIVDEDERRDLFDLLKRLTANDFELGEVLRSTELPLCTPKPHIEFEHKRFCFTGTFAFGSRNECSAEVTSRGGTAGGLTKKTDFLVIGEYATESWAQSSWGRKVESAVSNRDAGLPVRIVSEAHWRTSLY